MLANYLPRREALSSKSSGGLGAARGCTHADGRLILIFGMTGTTGRMSSFLRAIAEHAATLVSSSVLMVWPAAQGRQVRVRDPGAAMLTAGGWFDDTTPRCVNEANVGLRCRLGARDWPGRWRRGASGDESEPPD